MQTDPNELKRQEMVKTVAALPFEEIANNQQNSAFVLAYGKGTFGDYCAACHQSGGQGVIGNYPNLVDDAWLWGGDSKDIEMTITNGRNGNMPAHNATLTTEEIAQVSNYVLSLSGESVDQALANSGKTIFNTKGCSGCHTPAGTGMKALGSANLTDKIWTQANVPAAKDLAAKVKAIGHVVSNGIKRQMPAFKSRLSGDEIKVLTAYVKLLSAE
jgi:cytochrome c oxidase cbb3-type subunit 3